MFIGLMIAYMNNRSQTESYVKNGTPIHEGFRF